jgi:hypothetical protein
MHSFNYKSTCTNWPCSERANSKAFDIAALAAPLSDMCLRLTGWSYGSGRKFDRVKTAGLGMDLVRPAGELHQALGREEDDQYSKIESEHHKRSAETQYIRHRKFGYVSNTFFALYLFFHQFLLYS